MIQVKSFPIDKYQDFNDFVKKHSPRGENGIKFTTTHLMVFYEDGEMMTQSDRIQSLRFELGKHLEQMLQYEKQMISGRKIRDSFDYLVNPQAWQNGNAQYNQCRKMLELEVLNTSVVVEMLARDGENITVNYPTVPAADPEPQSVVSPLSPKKDEQSDKGKKNKKTRE